MKPTELLKEEHHGVKLVLRILGQLAGRIADNPVGPNTAYIDDFAKLIEFCRIFVDKCHHAKEEDVLFPALIEVGLPQEGGPVQVMLAEHADGRRLVSAMDEALDRYRSGDVDAIPALTEAVREYVELLTNHIAKEDNILYPIADARLSVEVQNGMTEAFEKIEEDRIGVGTHERFHEMLKEFKFAYLIEKASTKSVTLVYAAHDAEHNNAVALKEYISGAGL